MKKAKGRQAIPSTAHRKIEIGFLYVDLTACTRCIGTDAHLEEALSEVSRILEAAGVEVSVRKTLVESEEQAKALGFFSSPTIRINGKDIALEFRESRCESCESCAGNVPVNCRVWVFQGKDFTEAPKAMIVDAILREVYGGTSSKEPPARPRKRQDVPENLRRFFSGKAAVKQSSCCPPDEYADCCAASEKAECCEASDSKGCGCK
jgi:glutaredoxin